MATRRDSSPRGMSGGTRDKAVANEADEVKRKTGGNVSGSDQHEHDFRVDDDGPDQDGADDDHQRMLTLTPGNLLEAGIADRTDHQKGQCEHESQPGHRPSPI